MMKRDDSVYLRHILDAISRIEEYSQEVDYQSFTRNTLIQDGVIRQLEIIGEATKRLSPALRSKYASIPWKQIAGIRDKLIHDYFGVDIDAVWETLKQDLPALKKEVEEIIRSL